MAVQRDARACSRRRDHLTDGRDRLVAQVVLAHEPRRAPRFHVCSWAYDKHARDSHADETDGRVPRPRCAVVRHRANRLGLGLYDLLRRRRRWRRGRRRREEGRHHSQALSLAMLSRLCVTFLPAPAPAPSALTEILADHAKCLLHWLHFQSFCPVCHQTISTPDKARHAPEQPPREHVYPGNLRRRPAAAPAPA